MQGQEFDLDHPGGVPFNFKYSDSLDKKMAARVLCMKMVRLHQLGYEFTTCALSFHVQIPASSMSIWPVGSTAVLGVQAPSQCTELLKQISG